MMNGNRAEVGTVIVPGALQLYALNHGGQQAFQAAKQ